MTTAQKKLISYLVRGYFLRRVRRRSKSWYVLYDPGVNPIIRIREQTIINMDRYIDPKFKIWRHNKHRDMYLDLRVVRQLHGRSIFKKLYKQRDQISTTGTIYKQHTKQPKYSKDEKVNTLF